MSTLVYSPGVRIYVETNKHGILDVSDDITEGSLQLNQNAPHALSFTLANFGRKYDGMFTPDDRVVCQLKRLRWLQSFAGYLDQVPLYSYYPGPVPLTATCSFKKLQYTLYDPGTQAFVDLWNALAPHADEQDQVEAKFSELLRQMLVKVAKWCGPTENRIHIGALPTDWMTKINKLYQTVSAKAGIPGDIVGSVATSGGVQYPLGAFTPSGGTVGPFPVDSVGALATWQVAAYAAAAGFSGESLVIATAIAMAESGKVVGVESKPNTNGTVDRGLWQINSGHSQYDAQTLLSDPAYNAAAAFDISGGGSNFHPWSTFDPPPATNNGAYRSHMDDARSAVAELAAKSPSEINPQSGASGFTVAPSADRSAAEAAKQDSTTSIGSGPPYPMPDVRPRLEEYSWGGYANGQIPQGALTQIDDGQHGTYFLHPWAAKAYKEMQAEAAKQNVNLWVDSAYRDLAKQGQLVQDKGAWSASNPGAAPVGTSVHGYGFAIDIGPNDAAAWAEQYGVQWGWKRTVGNEAWHFEFWPAKFAPDNDITHGRVPAGTGNTGIASGSGTTGMGGDLTATYDWQQQPDQLSSLLVGARALMNDHPVMELITQMCQVSQRNFCSAPNGDFLAWFPDYFGAYGMAGRIIIEDIELQNFNIVWSDANLKTHQFVTGSVPGLGYGQSSGATALQSQLLMVTSMGIASVEFPELLQTLFNFDANDEATKIWSNPEEILKRFGARYDYRNMVNIAGKEQEFWWAVFLFQQNWARQFSTSVPVSFMPEAFPGMLMEIPSQGIQLYIEAVTHTWNLSNDGGFTTSISCTSPSTTGDNKFIGLPHAGAVDRTVTVAPGAIAVGTPSAGSTAGD